MYIKDNNPMGTLDVYWRHFYIKDTYIPPNFINLYIKDKKPVGAS